MVHIRKIGSESPFNIPSEFSKPSDSKGDVNLFKLPKESGIRLQKQTSDFSTPLVKSVLKEMCKEDHPKPKKESIARLYSILVRIFGE
jgi:hypothetical protein